MHESIVDVLQYVRPSYIEPGCSRLRLIEYALNLLDLCNRIGSGNIESRYAPKGLRATILAGEPIDAAAHFDSAGAGWRAALAAVDRRIRTAFEELMVELEGRMGETAEARCAGPQRIPGERRWCRRSDE